MTMQAVKIQTLDEDPVTLSPEKISSFRAKIEGTLLAPGQEAYEDARRVWNGMIEKRPALIARSAGTEDVVMTVNFAREHDLLLAIYGGGHNVAGLALCDGGLVVDLSQMNEIEVDLTTNVVRAGGGATIADLDRVTQKYGLAVPMGVVSKTGIAGLTLGGGIGWLRRKYGLSCDNLLAAKIVTADGRVRTASMTEHSDLFWALQGGGGNFGVVTEFTFQGRPIGPEVMFVFTFYDGRENQAVLRKYRDYCAKAPDEVSSFAISGEFPPSEEFPAEIHGHPYVLIAACYAGPVADGKKMMQPLRELGKPLLDFSSPMSYADEVQKILDEDYPDGMRYYWKSLFLDRLDDELLAAIGRHNDRRPGALSTIDIWHMGGAVARVEGEDSPFGEREAPYLLGIEANWVDSEEDAEHIAWVKAAMADLERLSSRGEYLNFPGFMEKGEETLAVTFGKHYHRLKRIKRKYDPNNLFRVNHNISPAS